jgi:acyl dehydratase
LVGREKIREFAKAVQSVSPLNYDVFAAQAAGYADVIAPPTLAVFIQERSLGPVLADAEVGIDFSRVVHGDQRFLHVRPIVAGDELTGVLEIASIKTLGAHAMVTMNTEIFNNGDELVCTAVSTLVVRGGE